VQHPNFDGRQRAVVQRVRPEVDGGRFPIKRTVGEAVVVEADAFADGHDQLRCNLRYRRQGAAQWTEVPMQPRGNDRWRGSFTVEQLGRYEYGVLAWVDHFRSWRHDLARRTDPADIATALQLGADLIEQGAARAGDEDAAILSAWAVSLDGDAPLEQRLKAALDESSARLMDKYPDRRFITRYAHTLEVTVDPERARFSAWYEAFPRSCIEAPGSEGGGHGSFRDCESRLAYVAEMGFDVLYLPPVHPIGRVNRKGRNNNLVAGPDEPGSPWAIGADEGGHLGIHPELGTLADFRSLVARAEALGIEIALDIAFQCAPDHPWVREHPAWFRWRPDGTVQFAENPPKKYEDIYPFDFESEEWWTLWQELRGVFEFWIEQGVSIFRVDNPHTKAFPFWEWVIGELKREHPQTIFLAEAFTRPAVLHYLAKLGFSQSYNYFPWRNTKPEITGYLTELSSSEGREYLRPNLWPNTPDILPEYLQFGGRPAFMIRLILAATLGASYGIYGPPFELFENEPLRPGSEEYLNSEKYQIRSWDLLRQDTLKELIARINHIRRENPALQYDWNLRFLPIENEEMICYAKTGEELDNIILVVVNLDPYHTQSGWVELPLEEFGLEAGHPYQMHDLLSDARYLWHGTRNYVELVPQEVPAHIFRLRKRVRSERDFDYYM
jgi:starch synthase (maltosyl-transferring)